MRAVILFMLVTFAATAAYGEVYKWEDENGMHFTDNPFSIPQKYREKVLGETRQDSRIQQSTQPMPLANKSYQVVGKSNPLAGKSIGRPQYPQHSLPSKKSFRNNTSFNNALYKLERFITVVMLMGACILLLWLFTLVDIIRSEFTDSSNKIVWFFLVFFLPLLGMILYRFIGTCQKKSWISPQEKSQKESLARLYPDKSKEGEFTIM